MADAIDTDQLSFNVDARFELAYDDARNGMVLSQAAELAISLFEPGWHTVLARCGTGFPGRGPSRLAEDAEIHARKRHPGSALLDNSALTPSQTLAELARLVSIGAGRLGPLTPVAGGDRGDGARAWAGARGQGAA